MIRTCVRLVTAATLLLACRAGLTAPRTLTVAEDGSGDFCTVREAVAAIPERSTERTIVHIRAGTYSGPVLLPPSKAHVTFEGEDPARTILTFDHNVNEPGPAEIPSLFNGIGVLIQSDDFQARNLTFRNTSGDHGQALALRIDGDRAVVENCHLIGWQDTLMVNNGRQYFHDCAIEGRVDFIYGSATAVFDRCRILSKNGGYVTAANTPQDHPFGLVFLNCALTGDPNPWVDPATGKPGPKSRVGADAYLGRPWRPYANVAFLHCELGAHIRPEGWNNWRNVENEKTARYSEFENRGPGADTAKRVPWSKQLTREEAANYTLFNILGGTDGWNPALPAATAAASEEAQQARYRNAKMRLVLAGDSTVTDQAGWGAGFTALLTPEAACINLARGGRSSRSFRAEGLWAKSLSLKPNYVFIQFGHNDQPGHGPERESDPKTYRENIARYVDETRAAGVHPILVTPLSRRQWGEDGKIHSTLEPYAAAVREVASEKKVPLLDLHALSIALYEKMGRDRVQAIQPRKGETYDGTHLNRKGSELIGAVVANAVRRAVPDLAPYVKESH